MDELRAMGAASIEGLLIGDPVVFEEYIVTKGQWLTYHSGNMPRSVLPDRSTPMYVIMVQGMINHVWRNGMRPDMVVIAIDVAERRVFAGSMGMSSAMEPLDVLIEDVGYIDVPAEVIQAHQFDSSPLPLPDAPADSSGTAGLRGIGR